MFFLPALFVGLAFEQSSRVTAQTFTTLHNFGPTLTQGAVPHAGLIISGNTLYGTAAGGGTSSNGTVFKVNTDGTGFTNLYNFSAGNELPTVGYTNSDGANPHGRLILWGNILYGTTRTGGKAGVGTVFKVNTDGSGFTNLHSFTYASDGGYPNAGLILSGSTLYGTAFEGGSFGYGTVFKLDTAGTGFTTLHSFSAVSGNPATNSDGIFTYAGLVLADNTLYGTAVAGGGFGNGNVFAINTDGTGFTNLHSFTATSSPGYTNSDGANPRAGLALSGNTLFGTTSAGGNFGGGSVFAINNNGTGFTNLYSFTAQTASFPYVNSDGGGPINELFLSGNTLIGTAQFGGSLGNGTVFALNTDGSGFTNLHSFVRASDGANPMDKLILSGNRMFGTAYSGGSSGIGTVFSLTFVPELTIVRSGTSVVLNWPTNVAGFDYSGYFLQSAPTITGTFTNIASATNPYTNTITGSQKYFRLISN
jgi:uncharacterized repeat protein (TIGR03803 family)